MLSSALVRPSQKPHVEFLHHRQHKIIFPKKGGIEGVTSWRTIIKINENHPGNLISFSE